MNKIPLILLILINLIIINFSGCNEEVKTEINLKDVSLILEDIKGNLSVLRDEHITDPYTIEEGLVLQGMYVLEKYEILFNNPESNTIDQTIVKFPNKSNAIHAIERTIGNYSESFEVIDIEVIGDMIFYAKNTTAFPGQTLYFISFSNENLFIIIFGTTDDQQDFIEYANIINTRINDKYFK